MAWSMLGLPVPHHLLEFAQVHVHFIGDAIQPSHPLLPSFATALSLSQQQGIFQWVICLHQSVSSVTQSWLTLCDLMDCRLPCPSPTPGACSNFCPLNQWCYPTISTSVIPSSYCLQSFPATGSFPMSPILRWPKYWSFGFSISSSNEHPWLISFWIDWFDLLAVQGTLKSLLQHHSSKAAILLCSDFFIV